MRGDNYSNVLRPADAAMSALNAPKPAEWRGGISWQSFMNGMPSFTAMVADLRMNVARKPKQMIIGEAASLACERVEPPAWLSWLADDPARQTVA